MVDFAQNVLARIHRGPATTAPLPFPRFCHQLDFSTSGALCVALNKAAAGSAYRCFKERRVTKAYLALVRPGLSLGWRMGTQDSQPTSSGSSHPSCPQEPMWPSGYQADFGPMSCL
jgi:23S rRNA-/tRNA-specific pseudouridylate synthase